MHDNDITRSILDVKLFDISKLKIDTGIFFSRLCAASTYIANTLTQVTCPPFRTRFATNRVTSLIKIQSQEPFLCPLAHVSTYRWYRGLRIVLFASIERRTRMRLGWSMFILLSFPLLFHSFLMFNRSCECSSWDVCESYATIARIWISMIAEVELNILRNWPIVKCRTLKRLTIKMRTAQALWYRHGNPMHPYFTHGSRIPSHSCNATSYSYSICRS